MKRTTLVGLASCLVLGLVTVPARAQGGILSQTVQPPERVESGPSRTIIVPRREVIVVERVHGPRGWWKKSQYRVVTLYYDGTRFYRRPFDRRVLRRVVVYEWGGRYYIDKDERRWERGRHHDH